jgi:LacI family transcriptional regulator
MVTLYDVARRAAVSIATVSRVVHGQDRVREATRIRVQQAIEELGYVPDGAAQSLSRRRKDIIGMMCVERETAGEHDVETECLLYYDEVQRGVQEQIRSSQWLLLSSFIRADRAGEPDLSRLNRLSGKVDGILVGEGFAGSRSIQRLAARLPVVIIAGTPGAQAADVVAADNFSGAAALITHLIADHGRQRLFHVGARRTLPTRSSGGSPSTTRCATTRNASSSAPPRESSASPAASRPGKNYSPGTAPHGRTPWCVPTTRWPSACCAPSPQPASASPTRSP